MRSRSGARQGASTALCAALLALALLPERDAAPPSCREPHALPAHTASPTALASIAAVGCRKAPPDARTLEGPARLLFGLPLDANRARAEWLKVLPGIGPARASAWVEERRHAPFCHLKELVRVRGIGPRTLERLAPFVAVGPAAACPGGAS